MKVATKFSIALMAGILLIHGTSATIWILRETKQIHEDIAQDEKVLGRAISHAVAEIWRVSGEEAALAHVRRASERQDQVAIRWVWLDASPGDPHAPRAPRDGLAALADGELVVVDGGKGSDVVLTYAPVQIPAARAGAIEIGDPLADEEQYLRESMLAALVTAVLLVALCTLLAWGLGMVFIGRPVRLLVRHARRVGSGDLTQQLSPRSNDEIGQLTKELSLMCDGLQQARAQAEAEMNARIAAVEQLRHADRLVTVGTLASGLAHELGTPINVVEGHAQLIREERTATEQCKENVEIIARQCKRMAKIIRDLLRFARRGESSGGSVDLQEVTDDTLRMLEPLAHKSDVRATIVGEDRLVARIAFDQMQQVLTNILVNGIQAMPDGGTILVRMSKERVAPPGNAPATDEYVCVQVEDSGHGMDEETIKRIFEPFFTTKDVGDGTGLGLSVAFGIVQDHGGWIDVRSVPGQGSVFAIYLPPGKAV